MIIFIDNGHGAQTPGKRSPDSRLLEYSYTRMIAREVVNRLKARKLDARLLVPEEEDVPLKERVRRVNSVEPRHAIVVSIHVNAAGCGNWMNASGWEAYTSPGKTLADTLASSLYFAATCHLPNMTIRKDLSDGDPDKEARFYILTKTLYPACLTENLFQDNRHDVDFLLSEKGKEAIISLHVDGILDFQKKMKGGVG